MMHLFKYIKTEHVGKSVFVSISDNEEAINSKLEVAQTNAKVSKSETFVAEPGIVIALYIRSIATNHQLMLIPNALQRFIRPTIRFRRVS